MIFCRALCLFRRTLFPFLALAVIACQDKPGTDQAASPRGRARVIRDIPVLPGSQQIDTTGAADAERATWQMALPFGMVTDFYRRELPRRGYRIVSDRGDSTVLDLYANKDRRDVWMHFTRKAQALTEWTIIGAAAAQPPDTTKRVAPRGA